MVADDFAAEELLSAALEAFVAVVVVVAFVVAVAVAAAAEMAQTVV